MIIGFLYPYGEPEKRLDVHCIEAFFVPCVNVLIPIYSNVLTVSRYCYIL